MLAQAFFVSAEVALSACDRNRLRARAAAGGAARASAPSGCSRVPQVTLATTLVGANLATLVAVLVVALELHARGISPLWAPLIVVPPLLVLGHLVPEGDRAGACRLARRSRSRRRSGLLSFVLRPLVVVVGGFAALLTRRRAPIARRRSSRATSSRC